jgi:predicted nucleic acid-binding Zn ribbon protein
MRTILTGFLEFLEFLPVLQVVENSPRRQKYKAKKKPKLPRAPQICAMCKKEFNVPRQLKYCSTECRQAAAKNRRPLPNDYTKIRTCVVCENPMPLGKRVYCSEECKKEQVLANVRNPFSDYGSGDRTFHLVNGSSMPTHSVTPDVLAKAEAYVEDYPSGIREDMKEINQIITEENIIHPAIYKKDFRSPKESGKKYWSVKAAENLRRKQKGLPKLPTLRHSNLERQLINKHEEKKQNPVIAIREKNYQIEKHTKGFATIGYSPRTKSGTLKSELVTKINAKNKS